TSQAYISGLERNKPYSYKTAEKLAKILGTTADELFYGNYNAGELEENPPNGTKIVPLRKDMGVPFYDIDVTGGAVTSFSDVKEEPEYYVNYQPFNDCTAYLPVFGNSMYPLFASG